MIVTERFSADELCAEVDITTAGDYGVLMYVCKDCLTPEEVEAAFKRLAAVGLDDTERALRMFDLFVERVPETADDPDFKAQRAYMEEWRTKFCDALAPPKDDC